MSANIDNEVNNTSSIGAVWPPDSGPFERIRGFYTGGVISSQVDCEYISSLIDSYQSDLEDQEESRLTIRFLAQDSRLSLLEHMGLNIEASIPLLNTGGIELVYVAHNDNTRCISKQRQQSNRTRLEAVASRYSRPIEPGERKLARLGYTYRLIDRNTPNEDIDSLRSGFEDLYGIFGYDDEDVRALLENPANTIVFAERNGQVASTAMAERADIEVEGFGTLSMYEITEASTHTEHRGAGLYRAVSMILIDHLISLQGTDPVHAIYGESNLAMQGVIFAGHDNGRRYSYSDRQRVGLSNPNFGILEQNFRVEDGTETRRYNDFAVSYLPLSEGGNHD